MPKSPSKRKRSILRTVDVYIAVSPISEGANIYQPGDKHSFFETLEEAIRAGWNLDEVVKAQITYKKTETL